MNDEDVYQPPSLAAPLAVFFTGILLFTIFVAGVIANWSLFISTSSIFVRVIIILAGIVICLSVVGFGIYKGYMTYMKIQHAREDLIDRQEDRRRANEQHATQLHLMTTRLHADDRGNRPFLLDPVDRTIIEVGSGNYVQPVPSHYSVTHKDAPAARVTEVPDAQNTLPPPMPVPTGRELLMNGDVVKALAEGKIILGLGADGKLKTLKIKKCFSTLVSGLPSSGKTTTVFWIVSQLVLIGAKLWFVDPHMYFEDEEGNKSLASELNALSDSFVFLPCDGEPSQVIDRVKWMYNQLRIRQRPGYIVRAEETIIGVMDEFNSVADSIDPKQIIVTHNGRQLNFSSTLALIEREGRKYGLHLILIGHKWTQKDIGGDNSLRTNATTYLCHRMNDKHQADLLISGGSKDVLALTSGSYWITGISWNEAPARITTPMISAVDIPLLLHLRQSGPVEVVHMENVIESEPVSMASTTASTTASTRRPESSTRHDTGHLVEQGGQPLDATTDATEFPVHLQVKMLQVLQMDEQGDKNQNDIIVAVWGVEADTRQGRAAKEELKQIRAYLAAKYLTR